jgi:hypothetical protein
MAKLNQQTIVITISELVKDSDTAHVLLTPDTIVSLEAVVQQLVSEGTSGHVVVEIQQA